MSAKGTIWGAISKGGGQIWRSRLSLLIPVSHGGRDHGAIGAAGTQEKAICLNVALRVRELLCTMVDVRLTRDTDIDMLLSRRLPVSNSACFVSIHCNAHITRTANGTETFHSVRGHAENRRLAQVMQTALLRVLNLRDRGVKTAEFRVIRQATVPAVLLELAFISNPAEEALLASTAGQERAAQAIAGGVTEFLGIRLAVDRRTHVVIAGDSLWRISGQHGVTVGQLREWNALTTDTLQIGQRLFVQA